jgi:hypothetical protein
VAQVLPLPFSFSEVVAQEDHDGQWVAWSFRARSLGVLNINLREDKVSSKYL